MIGVDHVRSMALYNRWQNESLYAADGAHRRGAPSRVRRLPRLDPQDDEPSPVGRPDLDERTGSARIGWAGTLTYFSPSLGHQTSQPRWLFVSHFFNHQTHHRGQIHRMLTQAGRKPADTDLPMMPG